MRKPFLITILMLFFSSVGNLYASENSKLLDSLLNVYNQSNYLVDLKNGEDLNNKIIKIALDENNKKVQIIALNNLSFFKIYNNDFLGGFKYSEQAIEMANELKNDTLLFGLYINKSRLFSKTDNIEGAIKYLLKARTIANKMNGNNCNQSYHNALAVFYYNQKEYGKSIIHFKLELLKAIHGNDTNAYRSVFDNIGLCYRNMGNYKMAEYYFIKAIYFAKKYKSQVGLVNASINLSKNFYLNNKLESAIKIAEYTDHVIELNQISIKYSIENSISLAKIYLQKKDYVRTDSVLKVIHRLLKGKTVLDDDIIDYLNVSYKKYKAIKSPLYIHSFEGYLFAKDSLENLKKIKLENSLKDKFAIAEKLEDYEKIEHNLIIKNFQNKWIITFGLIFLAGLIILLYMVFEAQKNIKELKLLQDEVNKQNKNLELYNKQKDYILATVAHDLRGPVGNINTITSVISMDESLNEENKTLIQLINQSADLSMSIINDLVDAINVDRKKVLLKEDKIILEEIIKTAVKMQSENLGKKKIAVQFDFFPGLEIKGDRNFIIRVLINLISNAVKFSNANTEIQIETSLFDENNVMIKIKDHGIGIDKDKLLTIFEPFTSASRRGVAGEKSIGLGLSICKKIVELHHGKIWVESTVNKGSEFYITLPINYLNQILKNIPVNF